jgi:hypothetical protein
MDMMNNDFELNSRLRSARRRKRIQKKDFDKTLLRFYKEEKAIRQQIWDLGWTELKPPVQQGYVRSFVLRGDVKRTKQASFFEAILVKINTKEWSSRKDFKKKRRRFGKKIYVVREQQLRDVEEREFWGRKFNDAERAFFYETLSHVIQRKKPIKVYRFTEPWRFVLRVQPNMITKVRVKDLDLERRMADIGRYFEVDNRRYKLWRLLRGYNGWKCDFPDPKYSNPLHNRSFSDILEEYYPEPILKISHNNPRKSRGFSFVGRALLKRAKGFEVASQNFFEFISFSNLVGNEMYLETVSIKL